jgi:hypothetical protein
VAHAGVERGMRTGGLVVVVMSGCFVATSEGDGGGAIGTRCLHVGNYDGEVCTTLFPVVCSGVTCATGQVCCQTTGACVDPGAAACPNPPTTARNGEKSCGSSADCANTEYCVPDDFQLNASGPQPQRCIGTSGHCESLTSCAYCESSDGRCQVCGCNGVTYPSPQAACVAGVWAPNMGAACGVSTGFDAGAFTIACGSNAQCPSGAECCARTGKCFDKSEPWRCEVQTNGSILNCESHGECNPGSGGGNGSEAGRLCAAASCGGPGLCSSRTPASSCGGEVRSVCGCDGATYVNECWARSAGTRVAHSGSCP